MECSNKQGEEEGGQRIAEYWRAGLCPVTTVPSGIRTLSSTCVQNLWELRWKWGTDQGIVIMHSYASQRASPYRLTAMPVNVLHLTAWLLTVTEVTGATRAYNQHCRHSANWQTQYIAFIVWRTLRQWTWWTLSVGFNKDKTSMTIMHGTETNCYFWCSVNWTQVLVLSALI